MAIGTTLDFKKKFDLDAEVFELEDISPYGAESIALADVDGIFTITDPNGVVIYTNTNFGTPDIDADVSLIFGTVSIPKDTEGNFILGIYTFKYSIQVGGATQPGVYTKTEEFDFCKLLPTVDITQVADCFCSKLTSTDITDYSNADATVEAAVRLHTIIPPAGSGLSNTVAALAAKTVTPITTKTWSTTISTVVTWTFVDDIVEGTVTGAKEITVNCDVKLCDVYCCINSLNNQYKAALQVNAIKAEDLFIRLNRINQLITLFDQAVKCGKLDTDGNGILTDILVVGDCTDECTCSDGTTPVQIVPLCGATPGGIVTVVAGAGITVTPNTVGDDTEYTVAMEATAKAKLDGLKNQEIQTDTPTEIEILHPAGDPDVYKVNLKPAAIPGVMDMLNFRLKIFYDAAGMTYTFEEIKTQGAAFKSSGIVIEGVDELLGTYADWLLKGPSFDLKSFLVDEITPIKYKAFVQMIDFTAIPPSYNKLISFWPLEMQMLQSDPISFRFRIIYPPISGTIVNSWIKNNFNPITLNILITG